MQSEGFLIIGGFSLASALIIHLFYNKNKKLLEEMWAVDLYSAKDLRRMVKGGFDAIVEVQGTISCENPILSLAANIPCCYCETSVERQDRRTRVVKSGSGTRVQTSYVWEMEINEKKSALFKVQDKTGDTLVDPAKATVDTETEVNKIVSSRELWFDHRVGPSDTGKYRIKESVLKSEGFVYVLGQASSTGDGDALIKYPKKGYMDPKKKFFLINRKSEKELTKKKQKVGRVLGIIRAIFLLAVLYSLLAYFHIAPGFIE